jgi:hypothetical protein
MDDVVEKVVCQLLLVVISRNGGRMVSVIEKVTFRQLQVVDIKLGGKMTNFIETVTYQLLLFTGNRQEWYVNGKYIKKKLFNKGKSYPLRGMR